jgi:hypothetical protein
MLFFVPQVTIRPRSWLVGSLFPKRSPGAVGVPPRVQTLEREVNLIGRGRIRCRYAAVQLRISDGIAETYEWDAVAGFALFPVLRGLLGFAGSLQFFDAAFRGADQEVTLLPNALFPGRRI